MLDDNGKAALRILQNARSEIFSASPFDVEAARVLNAAIGHLIGSRISSVDSIYNREVIAK